MKSRVSGTHALPSSRKTLFVFIPTNSDGQIFVNLIKKVKRKKFKNIYASSFYSSDHHLALNVLILFFFSFFLSSGTHMSLFIHS